MRAHSGAIYQIIFYSEDLNFIHIETTKSRSGADLLAALQRAVKFFSDRGASPSLIHQLKSDATTTNVKIVRMDNECSELTKAWLATTNITLELTPVAQHRTNKAERAIRTWKNHFLATLAGIDPECPLSLWENFIEQAELTLNLMRESPASPTMSAFESLCGKFDVNATPIAPLGMKVLVHDTPENRGTWQAHGKPGFYTGRALLHYRCHTVWMIASRATRISDCLSWHPVLLKMPGSSPLEELTAVIEDAKRVLTKLLTNPLSAHSSQPISDAAATLSEQLHAMRDLFRPPSAAPIEPPTAPQQRVLPPQFPPGIPLPCGRPPATLNVSWSDLNARPQSPIVIALPLPGAAIDTPAQTAHAPVQRVSNAQVPADINTTQPIPIIAPASISPLIIPFRPNQPISLPRKPRSQHSYFNLSPQEINAVAKPTFKRIGMQFTDDDDPDDIATGTVVSIVRHKQSRKLSYKYWDHNVLDQEPTVATSFDYIDVTYAISHCKWSKRRPVALIAAADDFLRKKGPSRSSIRKARKRNAYVPWYHKLHLRANSASMSTPQAYFDFHACTALDLNEDGTRLTSTSALKGPDKALWEKAHGEEIIRLIESQTGRFIFRHEMPSDRKAAYYNPQVKIKMKADGPQRRVRGTFGGDQVQYPGVTAAYTAHLETIRVLLNSIVSEHASILTADIKDFYLGTPLDRKEYMRINLKHIPLDVQQRYNIVDMVHNDHILMEISKGIYGLPQAGKLSQDRLVSHLATHGYIQCVNTPCLFVHASNGVAFTLVVDDFLIKTKIVVRQNTCLVPFVNCTSSPLIFRTDRNMSVSRSTTTRRNTILI